MHVNIFPSIQLIIFEIKCSIILFKYHVFVRKFENDIKCLFATQNARRIILKNTFATPPPVYLICLNESHFFHFEFK